MISYFVSVHLNKVNALALLYLTFCFAVAGSFKLLGGVVTIFSNPNSGVVKRADEKVRV